MSTHRHLTTTRAYGVAFRHDASEVLLVRAHLEGTAGGVWWLPGGGIDWGETPEAALQREFAEETGLVVQSLDLLNVSSDIRERPNGDELHTIRIYFYVEVEHGELVNEVGGTTDLSAWHPVADVLAPRTHEPNELVVAFYALDGVRWALARQAK
jgi:8-oxo-dGTP diphosphatase